MGSVSGGIGGVAVVFDEGSLVADAGLLAVGALVGRLGLEALFDGAVRPAGAGRGSGAEVVTAVSSMLAGGSFIDDADRLRSGSAQAVLPFKVAAPVALGTFLRSFTWGHVRRMDRAQELVLGRALCSGASPGASRVTVDVDSTVCEVHGNAKQGAACGHTHKLGYHPLVAVRDDTGEIVHSRMRSGASQRGHGRFFAETLARVRRLAPEAGVTVRADAGFFSFDLIDAIEAKAASWSITVPQNNKVEAAIETIAENAWQDIEYPRGGQAQVAETTIGTGPRSRSKKPRTIRVVVRRTRLAGAQAKLWPDWRYHCFATSRDDLDAKAADAYHRGHARVEPAIKDLKQNGLAHLPSGRFNANAAWLACAVSAHNIARWCDRTGRARQPGQLTNTATVRHRLINLPGRLVNRSAKPTLRLPANWPWAHTFTQTLKHIHNLPQHC